MCLLMTGTDRLRGDTDTPVVSQRSEVGQGILGIKAGRGKYDMWYDWVVKALVSSCMSVGRPLTEHLDLPCLVITVVSTPNFHSSAFIFWLFLFVYY